MGKDTDRNNIEGPHKAKDRRSRRRQRPADTYEVTVAGHLDQDSFDWFGEIAIANQDTGDALISGAIPDQPALIRLLLQLNDLGLTILSVKLKRQRR